jgi:hypothetical protein
MSSGLLERTKHFKPELLRACHGSAPAQLDRILGDTFGTHSSFAEVVTARERREQSQNSGQRGLAQVFKQCQTQAPFKQ